ncbi:MAG: CinA family protein [Firmicutes bacterium]|nr:CinA family protein [Bacillota bacterium]
MFEKGKELVHLLENNKKTISTMESCTGGGLANYLTNVEGSSKVLQFSAVTYSNEFKVKMGVDKEIIDKYTVYSMETAHSMSKAISLYSNSDYGIGITGQLNCVDVMNPVDDKNKVFISIYDKDKNIFYEDVVEVHEFVRSKNKETVISTVVDLLLDLLKNN